MNILILYDFSTRAACALSEHYGDFEQF